MSKYSKILSIWKNKMILSIWKKFSLNLEKCFKTVTIRLLFSKLLLILLFSHKILIFFKNNLGGPNLLLDPPVLFWGVHGPPGPPSSGPHDAKYCTHIGVAPIGTGGAWPPPVFVFWKRWYFSFRLASLNRNCVQYYNTTSVLYSVHYEKCNVRVNLQIQYVQMFLLSLYVRYTYNLCSISMYHILVPIIVHSYYSL